MATVTINSEFSKRLASMAICDDAATRKPLTPNRTRCRDSQQRNLAEVTSIPLDMSLAGLHLSKMLGAMLQERQHRRARKTHLLGQLPKAGLLFEVPSVLDHALG